MSFGYSAGDFFTAVTLIVKVGLALNDSVGSAQEYRHVRTELNSLRTALEQVANLEPVPGLEETVFAIKATASTCQAPLREFLEHVERYDATLGKTRSSGVMKDVAYRVRWLATKKAEQVAKLRAELGGYIGSINMLIGFYQMKCAFRADQLAREDAERIQNQLESLSAKADETNENISEVQDAVTEGTAVVKAEIVKYSTATSHSLESIRKTFESNVGAIYQTVGILPALAHKTYSKTLQIYGLLLDMQTKMPRPDTDHTWSQKPMQIEDAFGRPITIGPEFDFAMVEAVVKAKFRQGRGSKLVQRDQWQLLDPRNTRLQLTEDNWQFIPGMEIMMAMVIPQTRRRNECPRVGCQSLSWSKAPGGGFTCASCQGWFEELPLFERKQDYLETASAGEFNTQNEKSNCGEAYLNDNDDICDCECHKFEEREEDEIKDDDEWHDEEEMIDDEDLEYIKNVRVQTPIINIEIIPKPVSGIQLPAVKMTARLRNPGYTNFISPSEVKNLKLELLPLENRHEKKETCKYGGIEYKAEAKVMIDIRLLGGLRQSTQKFFVINCSTVGVLLGRQGTWAINDLLNDNNKARESFVGYMDAPPPHKALLASLPDPPDWLVESLHFPNSKYPVDRFEAVTRYAAIDPKTNTVVAWAGMDSNDYDLTKIRYVYLPRIRCHYCRGRLYFPDPQRTVRNLRRYWDNQSENNEDVKERSTRRAKEI